MGKYEMASSFISITGKTYTREDCPAAHAVSQTKPAAEGTAAGCGACPPSLTRAEEPHAQKAFRSIVNASNCANAGRTMPEAYVTLAGKGVLSKNQIY